MQIVIKIPEDTYKDIKEHGLCGYCSDREIVSEAILNGTPLPKGHDRLIEADEELFQAIRMWCGKSHAFEILENTPTILEAEEAE